METTGKHKGLDVKDEFKCEATAWTEEEQSFEVKLWQTEFRKKLNYH